MTRAGARTASCGRRQHDAFRLSSVDDVRAIVARLLLGATGTPERVGGITLLPHQRDAATRARAAIAEFGGVLLADAVGLGKTFSALSALPTSRRLLVAAPAALRAMWADALARAGREGRFVSHESLSRAVSGAPHGPHGPHGPQRRAGDAGASAHDALIVDEAHHARTPTTRRYAALASLAIGVPVVLLSATPVHNRPRDLRALLALFLGARSASLPPDALARVVIRRERAGTGADPRPALAPQVRIRPPRDDGVLDALLAIPPPVPTRDGGAAAALVRLGLVRQWASSDGALRASLRRRLAAAAAMSAALEEGRHPTHAELRAFGGDTEAIQLALVPLVVEATVGDTRELLASVHAHTEGLRGALAALDARDDPDLVRAERLLAVWRAHTPVPVVAFSQYAATIDSYWRALRRHPGACAITARGALVAGGAMTRADALARFAPRAMRAASPGAAERITLLLATDLVSEGLNLHDAGVVVHLDLPWTPARLSQRVGRVRRIGSTWERVATYLMAPPVTADRWAQLTRRLVLKARTVRGSVGRASPSRLEERCRRILARWLTSLAPDGGAEHPTTAAEAPPVAVVCGRWHAILALVQDDSGRAYPLAARDAARLSSDPRTVLGVLRQIDAAIGVAEPGPDRAAVAAGAAARFGERRAASTTNAGMRAIAARALRRVRAALAFRRGASSAGLEESDAATTGARIAARISRSLARVPRSRRARAAELAAEVRAALRHARGAGAERAIARAAAGDEDGERWLADLLALARSLAGPEPTTASQEAARASADPMCPASAGRQAKSDATSRTRRAHTTERIAALLVVIPAGDASRRRSPPAEPARRLSLPPCETAPSPPSSSTSMAP